VKIGTYVWLGTDVKVLKKVIIGDGAIISTGAIVTGSLEPNTIYTGVPAKKVKDNIYLERERH
jgi:acetyltransferase-like isoleucine patch superfamily enzyme